MVFSLRDFVIFFAGLEFFHTISHVFLALFVPFPIKIMHFVISYDFNIFSIMFNGIITVLLIWWACCLARDGDGKSIFKVSKE